MRMRFIREFTVTAFFLLAAPYRIYSADHVLAKDGVPNICVVVPGKYSSVELNAAEEFRNCFESVSGALPELLRTPQPGLYPVTIGVISNPALKLPSGARAMAEQIRHDGFLLYGDGSGFYIVSKIPRGTIYGVYEFFQRFANARWIFPGKDGEFYDRKKDWAIGDFRLVSNPGFQYREFNLVSSYCAYDTMKWMLRNKMLVSVAKMKQGNNYDWAQWGQPLMIGGHIFSSLLDDALFPAHPEYFALVNGRRVPQKDAGRRWQAQPCSTNPQGLKAMGDALEKMIRANPAAERLLILNNDTGGWCECGECAKLGDSGNAANRFWNIANSLAARANEVKPELLADVHGYQNFQEPPSGVKPVSGVGVNICVHHRCYVHSLGDPRCEYNARYRDLLAAWRNSKLNSIGTYEYTNCLPGWGYLPLERILAQDIAWYHRAGHSKYTDEVLPLDGFSQGKTMPVTPYKGSILAHYIQAVFLWNPDADFDSVYEDAGSRLYGAAWPAMKEYRELLRRCYERSNLYLCYGSGNRMLWKVLEQPRAEELLRRCLAEAERLAAGNRFLEEHIAFEKQRFEDVFAKAKKDAAETKSVFAGSAAGKIVLDGNDSETDWGCSEYQHDFRTADGKNAAEETWVKFLFDDEKLYLYFEAYDVPSGEDSVKVVFAGNVLHVTPDGIPEGGIWKGRTLRGKNMWKGEFACPLPKTVAPRSFLSVGVSRKRSGKVSSWNTCGNEAMPANARRVIRGTQERLKNGDFESVAPSEKDSGRNAEHLVPCAWACSGKAELVKGDASSGEYYIRAAGSGVLYQAVGLSGQTYRAFPKYPRIRVSADVRGKGRVAASFRFSDRKTDTPPQSMEVDQPNWKRIEFDFDCRAYRFPILYLFISLSGSGVCIDNIDFEPMNP